MFGKIAASFGALILAAFMAGFVLPRNQTWSSDGIIYSQMMLEDVGFQPRAAKLEVRSFYSKTPLARDFQYRDLLTDHPRKVFQELYGLFAARVTYPYVASFLFPRLGLNAMVAVSCVAYVLAILALYLLLSLFAPPWVALLGCVAFGIYPEIQFLGAAALTDMLAISLWIIALTLLLYYLRSDSPIILTFYALVVLTMVFTRPIIYLPLGAALGAFVFGWLRWKRLKTPFYKRYLRGAAILILVTTAIFLSFVAVEIKMHVPGVPSFIRWAYDDWLLLHQSAAPVGFEQWYFSTLIFMGKLAAAHLILTGTVIGWIFVMIALRNPRDWVAPTLAGAGISSVIALLVNPVPGDLARVVEAPLIPIVIAAICLGTIVALKKPLAPVPTSTGLA